MTGTGPVEALIRLNHAAVVTSLVSSVIHDLNNSLLVIGGSVELLEDAPPGEDAGPRLDRIRRHHHVMATRLRELGLVLKAEDGDRRADLAAVVTQACALRESALRRRGVTVRVSTDGAPCPVLVAPDLLLQIVLNLLLNAEAAVREVAHPEIVCSVTRGEGNRAGGVRLDITDSGPGVDPAVRSRLFEPFATSAPGERAGLGLYASRILAEQAGGTLDLTDSSNGATATLELPPA